jgi:HK97 family phage portal protein
MATWPSDDPTAERHWGFGPRGPVAAGTEVDEDTAYTYSPYWAGVQIYANVISSLPLPTYERLSDGRKKDAPDHPLYDLLHTQFNPEMTSLVARETLQAHLFGWGNAYCFIERDRPGGYPIALWPMDPSLITLKRDEKSGQLYYEFQMPDGTIEVYNTHQIFHIPGLGYNGRVGYSLVTIARESLGAGIGMDKFQANFLGKAAVPSGALEIPAELSEKGRQNLRKSLTEEHVDWENKRRPMILEGGTTWKTISLSQEDAEFIANRRFGVEEWARWFNLPVHLLREMTNSSVRANIEEESREAVQYSFRPWAIRWEQEFIRQLYPERDQKRYFTEFNFDGLLRGDANTTSEVFFRGLQSGRYSVNDMLRLDNRNAIGPEGDRRFVPMALMPLDKVDEMTEPQPVVAAKPGEKLKGSPEDEDKKTRRVSAAWIRRNPQRAFSPSGASVEKRFETNTADARMRITANQERLFVSVIDRLLRKEITAVKRAAKKHLPDDSDGFVSWLRKFYEDQKTETRQALEPLVATLLDSTFDAINPRYALTGEGGDVLDDLHRFVEEYAEIASVRHTETSRNQLVDLLKKSEGDTWLDVVTKRVDEWGTWRAGVYGRHEACQASNALARQIFKAFGVSVVRWLGRCAEGSPCNELDGRSVPIAGLFVRAGDKLADGEFEVHKDRLHPPLRMGCVCQIEAETE